METTAARHHPTAYWSLVAVLLGFGVLAIFSVGLPFLLLGSTLAVIAPWRHRPTTFWPAVAGVTVFVAGLVLALPWLCSSTTSAVRAPPGGPRLPITTNGSCSSVIGLFHYGSSTPSDIPALLIALALAAIAAAATHRAIARRDVRTGERTRRR